MSPAFQSASSMRIIFGGNARQGCDRGLTETANFGAKACWQGMVRPKNWSHVVMMRHADRPKSPVVVRAAPPGRRATTPAPESPPAPHRSQATAKAFWALMDRWQVPDEKALRLLDHVGGLTAAGKRPRFAMTGDEAKRFAYLMEIDTALQRSSATPPAGSSGRTKRLATRRRSTRWPAANAGWSACFGSPNGDAAVRC
jgi:hypothetical protein